MRKELQVITSKDVFGKEFSIYGTKDEPLFLAKDIAELIEYDSGSINKMINSVDEDEKLNGIIFRAGQRREVTMLTENGLYEVLMQSRKPIAKEFKKKVKEILKEIRKTGSYFVDSKQANINALSKLADRAESPDEIDAIIHLMNSKKQLMIENKSLKDTVEHQQELIEEYKPKADKLDQMSNYNEGITLADFSKAIIDKYNLDQRGIDPKDIYRWFRENEYTCKGRYRFNKLKKQTLANGYGIKDNRCQSIW